MLTFLSIIIPVYNTEKYLQECLDSVLSQKMDNIQILCEITIKLLFSS